MADEAVRRASQVWGAVSARTVGVVSFDVFFQSFVDGASARADGEAALRVLEPLVVDRRDRWASIVTADGSADIYGIDDPASGLMINNASGAAIWDAMFRLAQRAAFVIMPVGCGTYITDDAMRVHLPDGVPEPVVLIRRGSELLTFVES